MHILVTRIDAIGDVILALPLCGYLKEKFPGIRISILARSYTKAVIDATDAVDQFINYEEIAPLPLEEQVLRLKTYNIDTILHLVTHPSLAILAKKAKIPTRIGTVSRPYHWLTCNKYVWLRRKVSDKHEAELHFTLAKPLGIKKAPEKMWQYYQLNHIEDLKEEYTSLLDSKKFNIILHPKSNGNAQEWDLKRFGELANLLDNNQYKIFITGSEKEKAELKPWIDSLPSHVVDMTGKLSLPQLLSFIKQADGLLAASTGPLHIAAATGINTLGLYPNFRPKHGDRWGPIGPHADYIQTKTENLDSISAQEVFEKIKRWKKLK